MNLYERIHANRPHVRSCYSKLAVREPLSIKRAQFLQNNQVRCESALYAWQIELGYVCPPEEPALELILEQVHLLEIQIAQLSKIVLYIKGAS